MQDATLTLTGGWAIFVIACIIYFIANIVYGFGLFIEKKIKEKKNKKFINNKDMTEELKKALTERFEQLSSSVDCDEQIKDALLKAYLAGGEYGYQYAIEKVYRFLEKYAANFVALPDEGQQPIGDTNAIYGTKSLIHYLRQEMGD